MVFSKFDYKMGMKWQNGETITLFNGRKFKRDDNRGSGGYFGDTFKVTDVLSGTRMIVKRASDRSPGITANETAKDDALKREAFTILTLPPHPHIVQGYIVALIKGDYHIFMELVEDGDLSALMSEHRSINKKLEWKELYPLIYQIAVGIKFLHSKGVIHKDLKPDNILVKKITNEDSDSSKVKHIIKIADFGLVGFRDLLNPPSNRLVNHLNDQNNSSSDKNNQIDFEEDERTLVGSGQHFNRGYAAPEQEKVIPFDQKVNKFTDIFSFGLIVLELMGNKTDLKNAIRYRNILSSCQPLTIRNNLLDANRKLQAEIDLYLDTNRQETDERLKTMVKKCLELNSLDRFQDFVEILSVIEEIYDIQPKIKNNNEFEPSIPGILFWALRGDSLKVLGFPNSSIEAYRKALPLPCKSLSDHFNKGRILQELGEHDKAILEFDEVSFINEDYIDAYIHKGVSYSALGDHHKAVSQYTRAEQINAKDSLIHYNKGNALRRLEQYDDAITSFNEAIKLDPCYVDALYNKARCLCIQERFEDALPCVETALDCAPWDRELQTFKTKILDELQKRSKG